MAGVKAFRERWVEFFEDGDPVRSMMSMTRLLAFLAFFPASWVVIKNPTEGNLGLYLGAFVVLYVGGKGVDALANGKPTVNVEKADVVGPNTAA